MRAIKSKAWSASAAIIGFFALLAMFIYGLDNQTFILWIFGPIGIATAAFIYFQAFRWKWTTVAQRVQFVD